MSIHVQIYLGISAISRHKHGAELGGTGGGDKDEIEILSEGIVIWV